MFINPALWEGQQDRAINNDLHKKNKKTITGKTFFNSKLLVVIIEWLVSCPKLFKQMRLFKSTLIATGSQAIMEKETQGGTISINKQRLVGNEVTSWLLIRTIILGWNLLIKFNTVLNWKKKKTFTNHPHRYYTMFYIDLKKNGNWEFAIYFNYLIRSSGQQLRFILGM